MFVCSPRFFICEKKTLKNAGLLSSYMWQYTMQHMIQLSNRAKTKETGPMPTLFMVPVLSALEVS
jgi:hypothetical protein